MATHPLPSLAPARIIQGRSAIPDRSAVMKSVWSLSGPPGVAAVADENKPEPPADETPGNSTSNYLGYNTRTSATSMRMAAFSRSQRGAPEASPDHGESPLHVPRSDVKHRIGCGRDSALERDVVEIGKTRRGSGARHRSLARVYCSPTSRRSRHPKGSSSVIAQIPPMCG